MAWHGNNSGIAFSNVCACVQEYNICFTTVVKGVRDGGADESTLAYDLPDKSLEQGVLPSVLRWAWPLARTSTLLPMRLPWARRAELLVVRFRSLRRRHAVGRTERFGAGPVGRAGSSSTGAKR
jgi:hypothetical protein